MRHIRIFATALTGTLFFTILTIARGDSTKPPAAPVTPAAPQSIGTPECPTHRDSGGLLCLLR